MKWIWRRGFLEYLAAIVSGVLLGTSQPLVIEALGESPVDPTGLSGFLVFVAYIPVFLAAQNASVKRSFFLGFLASLIQYAIIVYWLIIAMTVFGGVNIWFSILVLMLTCGILACYIGSAFALAQYLRRRLHWSFVVLMPMTLCSVEYLRNYIFVGGFPWGASGYALATIPILLQSASLIGIYGLVFYIVLINGDTAAVIDSYVGQKPFPRYALIAVAATSVLMIYGGWRLQQYDPSQLKSIKVALLQGNIEQGIKNKASMYSDAILLKYRRLHDEAASRQVDMIIWPEASFPLRVPNASEGLIELGVATPSAVVGAVAMDKAYDQKSGRWEVIHYNTAFVLGPDFNIVGRFDKSHLVPFGEYVPWPFEAVVNKVVPGLGAFARGRDFKPVDVALPGQRKVPIGVTICYEGVFPEISRAFANHGAEFLINLTNDAWYGVSSAPYQHLYMYRLRAVETGRAYARATNTGVSAWIDSRGFVHAATPLYQDAVVSATIPVSAEKTPYLLFGDVVAYLSLIFVLFAWMIALVGKNVLTTRRASAEWILGLSGFALIVWSHWYFAEQKFNMQESASTKDTFVTAFGFLVAAAALAGKPWGRKALMWAGAVAAFMCTLIAYAEGAIYLMGALVGAVVFVLAWLRPRAYQ